MIQKAYLAVPGSSLSHKDAARIGGFLDRKFGDRERTAEDVVAAARPKRSPIHNDFEWDDAAAAESWRIEQAKYMIRSIQVVFKNGAESPPTKAYHSVVVTSDHGEQRRAYVPARVVWATPDLADQVLAQAKAKLQSWADQYRSYESLAEHVSAVEEVVERIAA